MEESGSSNNGNVEDNKKYWKWGLFYYNPDDKNFFHSKKNRDHGVTINFAHPSAKYFVAFFLLIILAPFLALIFIK